ncbi:MAG: hypothetical protein ACRD2Q_02505 [Terriglobales bacterium]
MKNNVGFWRFTSLLVLALFLLVTVASSPAWAQDEPTIAKDSIQVTAWSIPEYRKNDKLWSWVPKIDFRVNGPIASGSQLYVEFKLPTGPWVSFDCKTGLIGPGYWWDVTECGGNALDRAKGVTHIGQVSFSIGLRNEVTETNQILFSGKAKVGRVPSNTDKHETAAEWVYYVDHDWNLPIGYIFLDPEGGNSPKFLAAFWVRGSYPNFEPHLFYNGKEVGRIFIGNTPVGKARCDARVENATSHYVDPSIPQKARWEQVECQFPSVLGWDKSGEKRTPIPGEKGELHVLSENPGEYEIKAVSKGELARSIKFTVAADGSFDNGIATANKLGSDRVIVSVKVIGTQEGNWDRLAWKTGAFYGHPLTGFSAPP